MSIRLNLIPRSILLVAVLCGLSSLASAQTLPPKDRGFVNSAQSIATGEEITSQENLWVLEVKFKSLRMIAVDITDAKTGEKKKEFVWYFVYKATNRAIEKKVDDTDTEAINDFDAPPGPPIFAPEFLLQTNDNNKATVHRDVIVPQAQAVIERREKQKLLNSVQIVGDLPKVGADGEEDESRYGVAMFTGIDPRTDYFTLILNGFSNGYRYVRGPARYDELAAMVEQDELKASDQVWDGNPESAWMPAGKLGDLFDELQDPPENDEQTWFYTIPRDRFDSSGTARPMIWRKTLRIKYWRPGDRFDQDETEFRQQGEPTWIYRADEPTKNGELEADAAAPADEAADDAAAANNADN